MQYLKCVPCKIRLDRAGPEAHLFDRRCPICGSTLEAADHLSELVGFRSFDLTQGDEAFATPSADPHRSVGRVRKAMSARDAALTPGGLDANRWLDDGGRFSSEAVARWSPPKK